LRADLSASEREELGQLKHEVCDLKRTNEILRQAAGFFRPSGARPQTEVMVSFIDQHRHVHGVDSLREITGDLSCCLGKLTRLGVGKAPNKSGLSYADQHRPTVLYEDIFWVLLSRLRQNGQLGTR
jgi:hypothetical protein